MHGSRTNSRGVAILIGKNFDYKISDLEFDSLGNYISVLLHLSDFSIKIINIYAPNNDSPDFFKFVSEKIVASVHDYCILCGDFNLVLDPAKDCYNYKSINNPNARRYVLEMMNTLYLKDAYRFLNENLRRYTWHRKRLIKCARLDYFLISEPLTDLVDKCMIKQGYRSDHSIVELIVTICRFQRGRGVWKFNCSLLKDKEYLITVNNLIDRERLNYALPVYHPHYVTTISDSEIEFTISDATFLETLLLQARGETIRYASRLKKEASKKEQNIKKEIESLEKNFDKVNLDELDLKKKELENLRKDKMKGVLVRSRAQWLSEGERPSKYFCSLEIFFYVEKTIRKIITDFGKVITDQKEILSEVKNYYATLFKNGDSELSQFDPSEIASLKGARKLSEQDSRSLEGLLKIEEIGTALRAMKNHKCPGIDGFPAEF